MLFPLVEAGCHGANGDARDAVPANEKLGLVEVDTVVVVRLRPFDNPLPVKTKEK